MLFIIRCIAQLENTKIYWTDKCSRSWTSSIHRWYFQYCVTWPTIWICRFNSATVDSGSSYSFQQIDEWRISWIHSGWARSKALKSFHLLWSEMSLNNSIRMFCNRCLWLPWRRALSLKPGWLLTTTGKGVAALGHDEPTHKSFEPLLGVMLEQGSELFQTKKELGAEICNPGARKTIISRSCFKKLCGYATYLPTFFTP